MSPAFATFVAELRANPRFVAVVDDIEEAQRELECESAHNRRQDELEAFACLDGRP